MYDPNKAFRVHEVESIDVRHGTTIARYRGGELLQNKSIRTILTEVLPRAPEFNPLETDNGIRLEVWWPDQAVKYYVYGTQKG